MVVVVVVVVKPSKNIHVVCVFVTVVCARRIAQRVGEGVESAIGSAA